MAGVDVPLLPLAHQYATTAAAARARRRAEDGGPARRRGEPARSSATRTATSTSASTPTGIGIGSYAHRPMPVDPFTLPAYDERARACRPRCPSPRRTSRPAGQDSVGLLPALGASRVDEGFNGVFSFTPDGMPVLGESRELRGFWLAEAVWVTHSAGRRQGRRRVDDRRPARDRRPRVRPLPLRGRPALARLCRRPRRAAASSRSTTSSTRSSPWSSRGRCAPAPSTRASRSSARTSWRAAAGSARTGTRPTPRSPDGLRLPERDAWSARYWSPIAAAEARATREKVALYDMTPLRRLEVTGPGALDFLQRMTSNNLARSRARSPTPCSWTRPAASAPTSPSPGSAPTASRSAPTAPADLDWLLRHAPDEGVQVRDITSGTCCIGVWGPLARELVQPLTRDDFSHRGLRLLQGQARPTSAMSRSPRCA